MGRQPADGPRPTMVTVTVVCGAVWLASAGAMVAADGAIDPGDTVSREAADPFLAQPALGCLWEVPVLVITCLPSRDGTNVDPDVTGMTSTVADARDRARMLSVRTKFALEEGSRFHACAHPDAKPSIGYRIVDMWTVLEPLPHGEPAGEGVWFPDYDAILRRFDIRHYVEDLGVKQVWLWGYHHGEIVPAESNMASPASGDISNSYRFPDDMPILSKTYVLYNYNITRDARCAVENHGHQLESQLDYIDADLFRTRFAAPGRCGNVHCPPNTTKDYDVANPTAAVSDIADWTPDGTGASSPVSAATWLDRTYDWPDGVDRFPEWDGLYWFIYWMQSFPGRGNTIRMGDGYMTNWWAFVGDWDGSLGQGLRLYAGIPAAR